MTASTSADGAHPRLKTWLRRGLAAVALTALGAGGFWLARPKPTAVESALAAEGRLEATLDEEARTRVRDRYVIAATVSGNLRRLALRPGDSVAAGDAVARILPADPTPLDARSRAEAEGRVRAAEAAVRQAGAAVDRAQGALEFARAEAARVRRLATAGSSPPQELATAEFQERSRGDELASARFAASGAAYQLEGARALLARGSSPGAHRDEVVMRSPVGARVLRVLRPSEGPVSAGTPLLEVGDTGALEVVADLLTSDALAVAPGARVHLDLGGAAGSLEGRVRLVEPSATTRVSALGVEEQRVDVLIDLLDPPARWRAMGDGWRVEARVVVWEGERVLTVPLGAVFRHRADWCVFVIEAGHARRRSVSVGHQGGAAVEITRGVRRGERVIVHPPDRLEEGEAVVPG